MRTTAAKGLGEEIRGLEQPIDRNFNNKLDIINAEVKRCSSESLEIM